MGELMESTTDDNPDVVDLSRVKLVRLPLRDILDSVYRQTQMPSFVYVPNWTLPEGYRVIRSGHDWLRNCLEVVVQHPSFEPVRDGEVPPPFDGEMGCVWTAHALATPEEVARRSEL